MKKLKDKANVVVYLTDDKKKDDAVIRYCHDKRFEIVKVYQPYEDESDHYWNTILFEMYFEMFKLSEKYKVKYIITYELENLFWCQADQVAISLMFFDSNTEIFTLKEGNINDPNVMKINLNLNKDEIQTLKKYWVN